MNLLVCSGDIHEPFLPHHLYCQTTGCLFLSLSWQQKSVLQSHIAGFYFMGSPLQLTATKKSILERQKSIHKPLQVTSSSFIHVYYHSPFTLSSFTQNYNLFKAQDAVFCLTFVVIVAMKISLLSQCFLLGQILARFNDTIIPFTWQCNWGLACEEQKYHDQVSLSAVVIICNVPCLGRNLLELLIYFLRVSLVKIKH